MRKWLRRSGYVLVILAASNLPAACTLPPLNRMAGDVIFLLALLLLVLMVVLRPLGRESLPTRRIRTLAGGAELLQLFLVTATANVVSVLAFWGYVSPWEHSGYGRSMGFLVCLVHILAVVVTEAAVFWGACSGYIVPRCSWD